MIFKYLTTKKASSSKLALFIILTLFTFPQISAAHWIAGYVEDALDSTSPNGRTVRLWNPLNSQEVLGIVGPSGLSGTSNIYMIDCEMLTTPCQVGDKVNITLVDDASGYTAKNPVEVTVSGAGFDMAANISMNTPLIFTNVTVEDTLTSPLNEIDLTPATSTPITCFGVISNQEGEISISEVQAKFFSSSSSFASADDNNSHYSNSTCEVNTSYGEQTQAMINCTFQIEYYASAGSWQCQINATDNYSSSKIGSDSTNINTLLALGVNSPLDFGEINAKEVSQEKTAEVINYGNIPINLSLSGYGQTISDGNAMECGANDISVNYMKYNLTASNSSNLTLSQFDTIYKNLTSSPVINKFNLNFRQDDAVNDAKNNTYWRVYLPQGINSVCSGNIVFGASRG